MKFNMRMLAAIVFISILLFCFVAASPRVSSVTETTTRLADNYRITKISWTADSTGAITSTATTDFVRGIVFQVITVPDTSLVPATADSSGRYPTDNYDITLTNTLGIDVYDGLLGNRDTTTPEAVKRVIFNNSKLTTAVTNNSIPNARGHIYIYWQEK